jgi:hypothetical protein
MKSKDPMPATVWDRPCWEFSLKSTERTPCEVHLAPSRHAVRLPRLRSGFRQRAQTPAKRLNFDSAPASPRRSGHSAQGDITSSRHYPTITYKTNSVLGAGTSPADACEHIAFGVARSAPQASCFDRETSRDPPGRARLRARRRGSRPEEWR